MAARADRRFISAGEEAYHRGLGKTRCPYPPQTPGHQYWLEGWLEAERRDTDEELGTFAYRPVARA